METYNIYYTHEDREGVMRSHCLEESIDYLLDHGCVITDIRDMSTGEIYRVATNVRKIEEGQGEVTAMHTYTIFYIYDDTQGVMHSHDLNDAIDWLLDHNCAIISAHDETGHKCWEYGGVCEDE